MSDWYYAVDNEQKGPINESELKENLAANKIPADSLVWKDGMDAWTPANQVPAFSFRQPPIPAKVQPGDAPKAVTSTPTVAANPDSTTPVDLSNVIGTPEAVEVDFNDAEKNKAFGILAYIIFFIPLICAKDSPFAKYHANQGLALAITMVVSLTVLTILGLIPFIGWLFWFVNILVYLGFMLLVILGIVNAANGKCVPLPVVGSIKPINNLLK